MIIEERLTKDNYVRIIAQLSGYFEHDAGCYIEVKGKRIFKSEKRAEQRELRICKRNAFIKEFTNMLMRDLDVSYPRNQFGKMRKDALKVMYTIGDINHLL